MLVAELFFNISALLLLLVCSGVISASEVVFFSVSKNDLNSKDKHKNAEKRIKNIISKPDKLLATILVWNNFVNILIILLFSRIINSLDFDITNTILKFLTEVLLVLFLILIFGELLPKVFVKANPLKYAKKFSKLLVYLIKISTPLTYLLTRTSSFMKIKTFEKFNSQDISKAIEIHTKDLTVTQKKSEMISKIPELTGIDVKSIMQPSQNVKFIRKENTFQEVKSIAFESGHSRFPVIENTIDNIIGMIHIKTLMGSNEISDWKKNITPTFFVSENTKLDLLLYDFKEKKTHFAVVNNEYGATVGIITLEDIIEEIFGEISDEFDNKEKTKITKIEENLYSLNGDLSVKEFIEYFNIKEKAELDKYSKHTETIAGAIIEKNGEIPKQKTITTFDKIKFVISESDSKKIKKINISFIK